MSDYDQNKFQIDMWDSQVRIGILVGIGASFAMLGIGGAASIYIAWATLGESQLAQVNWPALSAISIYLAVWGFVGLVLFFLGVALYLKKRRDYFRIIKKA